jgi:hypothetical protein
MSGAVYRFRARLLHRLGLHNWRYHIGVPDMGIVSPATRRVWHTVGGAETWRVCSWCGAIQTRPWDVEYKARNGGSAT